MHLCEGFLYLLLSLIHRHIRALSNHLSEILRVFVREISCLERMGKDYGDLTRTIMMGRCRCIQLATEYFTRPTSLAVR